MDSFTLTTCCRVNPFRLPTRITRFSFTSRPSFVVFASKDEPKLDNWDQMELKFGRLLGEDPKLTLAKIASRKANPDVSYLDIEKSFSKKKIPLDDEVVEEFQKRHPPNSLNLVRPVPKKGVKFEQEISANKPFEFRKNKARPSSDGHAVDGGAKESSVPKVILRKPSAAFPEDDVEVKKPSRLRIMPNLSLKIGKGETKESFSDITLLKRPEPMRLVIDSDHDNTVSSQSVGSSSSLSSEASEDSYRPLVTSNASSPQVTQEEEDEHIVGLQPLGSDFEESITQPKVELQGKPSWLDQSSTDASKPVTEEVAFLSNNDAVSTAQPEVELQGKPSRLDQPSKDATKPVKEEVAFLSNDDAETENFIAAVVATAQPEVELQGKILRLDQLPEDASKPVRKEAVCLNEDHAEIENFYSAAQPEVELQVKPPRLSSKDKPKPVREEVTRLSDDHSEIENLISAVVPLAQPEVQLQGKPPRLDQSLKETSEPVREEVACSSNDHAEIESFMSPVISAEPLLDREHADWSRAEYAYNTGGREEVELISCSTRGFVASFGSLIGFLPYRNLNAKWKFLAFESWLRKKGLDPAMYRQNLGIVGRYESADKNLSTDTAPAPEKVDGKLSPNMKLEDLLEIYDQEKIKFLTSFVGMRTKVNVVLADRNSRKLMFSGKPKEKEELVLKKRNLMSKLNIGDVVKCCIKKITYFGIFVEVEGVPALIHQSEVSWDITLDPSSFFKLGQIVEAKVHQLDFALDRILLSLKEITPDPLIEALESVVGGNNYSEGKLDGAQTDIEWADVKSLIKELEDIEGVQSVAKGRFFLSPGLAPTFQVYMASMFQNQYKLLARSGNKVQEVIVQASLEKEEMKAAILACTNRVV